ncbi:MAG TPA: precorrin-6A/cobalt-precorrin-6A reductase [Dongiaceae bacterium]|nr:precorrin-6A/cobalt-precorrin-6A reductase [Dongiaceae bacterium]
MPVSPNLEVLSGLEILLLGETGEAAELAAALQAAGGCKICRPHDLQIAPEDLTDGARLTARLSDRPVKLVVNAADPYDIGLSDCALAAANAADIQLLRVLRPAWKRDLLDSWIDVSSVSAAADICRWYGKRVLITLAEADLGAFAGNDRCHFVIRLPQRPAQPLALGHHDLIIGHDPFPWLEERRLMMEQQIDLIVCRNSGGLDAYAKVDVARDLAIPVVMISRPPSPAQPQVETVGQAVTWIDAWRQTQR